MAIYSSTPSFDRQELLDNVSEKDKSKEPYLIGNIAYWISHLVVDKPDIKVAYDYFHSIRDKEEFKYLEDNYGLSNAFDLKFIPLVRKHIEVLKGQFLTNPFKYFATCSDEKTINTIEQQKWDTFLEDFFYQVNERIQQGIEYIRAKEQNQQVAVPLDSLKEDQLTELWEYYNTNWKSMFEISVQNVIEYLMQSKTLNFKTKLTDMFEDMLISGSCFYRVKMENEGEDPELEVINPLHCFYNKNTNDRFINESTAFVYRFYRTPEEIINQYGHHMTKEEVDYILRSKSAYGVDIHNAYSRNLLEEVAYLRNKSVTNSYYNYSTTNTIECYHVEWLANNEETFIDENGEKQKRYRLDRYHGYQFGNVYLPLGKDENVVRSSAKPWKCPLSYNGISNTDRNGIPYSLMLQTKELQDRYDIYYFHRDNVVHNSGVKGLFMDVSMIPKEYGDTPEERQLTFMTMLKQGVAPINTAQDGVNPAMNTVFSNFDLTLDVQTVQAYNLLIEIIEQTVSSITGVTRQMLANIEQRDAVTNTQVGINQGLLITKPMFHLMDTMIEQSLIDLVNMCKKSFQDGKVGAYVLGDGKQRVFSIAPDDFCFTDYNVHIVGPDEQVKKLETARAFTLELIKAQQMSMDSVYKIINTDSLTEMAEISQKDIASQRAQQLSQAMEQVNQLSSQLDELTKQNKVLTTLDVQNKQSELAIKQQEAQSKFEIEERKLAFEKEKLEKEVGLKHKQIQAEVAELFDNSEKNDEIKNI